jgi:putative ABC transport system ATP-binding protein
MTAPILSARDVRKSYGRGANRFDALKGVSLDIREGESIAIIGKSGSGKSTLMHVLALLDQPTDGTIALAGHDTRSLTGTALNRTRNKTFGFVFQQFFLTPNASVLENVILPLKIAGVGRSERKRRGLAALEQLELADKAKNKAVNLSGGQKQRTVIARALVNTPRVIFADEPTGNLDTATGAVVEDILFELNREHGITLIIVTHDEELAARCDRQVHIRDGLIVDGVEATTASATTTATATAARTPATATAEEQAA